MTKYMLLHIPSGECIIFSEEIVSLNASFTLYKAMDLACDNKQPNCLFECGICPWARPFIAWNRAEYLFERIK